MWAIERRSPPIAPAPPLPRRRRPWTTTLGPPGALAAGSNSGGLGRAGPHGRLLPAGRAADTRVRQRPVRESAACGDGVSVTGVREPARKLRACRLQAVQAKRRMARSRPTLLRWLREALSGNTLGDTVTGPPPLATDHAGCLAPAHPSMIWTVQIQPLSAEEDSMPQTEGSSDDEGTQQAPLELNTNVPQSAR